MSLPLIADTAAEVHRLAIAGSALAAGDFRLKKILPQLDALGAKAPIFTRIAQGVKAVIDESDAAKAGRALLDLSTLLTAIQYTQSPHGAEGEFTPVNTTVQAWTPTVAGYRTLAAVVQALTSTGEGRLEVVRDACQRGLFRDLRLLQPAVGALSDRFGELADFVADHATPQLGPAVIPLLKAGFDPKGGNAHARRLRALCAADKEEGRIFCRAALDEATKEVKLAVIAGLTGSEADLDIILGFTKQRSAEVKLAAVRALRGVENPGVIDFVRDILAKAESNSATLADAAAFVIAGSRDLRLITDILDELDTLVPDVEGNRLRISRPLKCLEGNATVQVRDRLLVIFHRLLTPLPKRKNLNALGSSGDFESGHVDALTLVAGLLLRQGDKAADRALMEARGSGIDVLTIISLAAGARILNPQELFALYSPILRQNDQLQWSREYIWSGSGQFCEDAGGELPELPREAIALEWTGFFVELRIPEAVAELAKPGQAEAATYLKSASGKRKNDFLNSTVFAEAIVRADPESAIEWCFDRLGVLQKQTGLYPWYAQDFWKAMGQLPPSSLPRFEAVAPAILPVWQPAFSQAFEAVRLNAASCPSAQ